MAYVKTTWTDAVTPLSAGNFNKLEQGVADAHTTADAALPAASYTAADVLTKIKTVDGSGSGLDADTVKGYTPVNKAGDTITGTQILNNNVQVSGKDTGATARNLVMTATDNTVRIGDAAILSVIQSSATPGVKIGATDYTMWATDKLRNNSGVLEFYDSGTWKAVGGVKNVQRGLATLPADTTTTLNVTISAVNLSKSFVTISQNGSSNSALAQFAYGRLTSTTNLEITRATNSIVTNVAWEVIESY